MNIEKQLNALGFRSKENAVDVFEKKYPQAGGYSIEVIIGQQRIDYGVQIKADSKTTQNFSQPEKFQRKALTLNDLSGITQEDCCFIFNSLLEILRHNVVSDKPNAFNKIFTLFLCKIYDEKTTKPDEELKFQWLEGRDNDVSFQIRLTNLYKEGMLEFLEREVTDFSEDDFNTEYKDLNPNIKESLLRKINKLRLEKNNEFAIKEVFDEKTFKENAKIVKEVVELLQRFRLRYNKRQQYLSDFFELLLTTGLKQEAGQFFTPVPIAQFIIKSLPIDKFVDEKLDKGTSNDLLPYLIDYAAGSGHFITESMHEIQRLIDEKKADNYVESTAKKIKTWQNDHFDWAMQYVYGVEKDYRLVKVGKVGCYLHGDGLANVVLSDGLANFNHSEYKGKLRYADKDFPKENKQFDIVVSNPPYSVSAFKNTAKEYYAGKDFDLYDSLTDSSGEIECLFIERAKQLLKDGGVAGIILPTAVLNSAGIYIKARALILRYFEIIAIVELGVNTFMATKIKTNILFLRRRNNYHSINLLKSTERFFEDWQDVTRNGIENAIAKYVDHVWKDISLDDYLTLLKKKPNDAVEEHDIYKEYRKKINVKTEKDFWNTLINTEKEKLYYFFLTYPQKNVVLIKTGEKDAEKRFLGYEFSERERREGIHSIAEGKTIEESTCLFDEDNFENPQKASSYIYNAFKGNFSLDIHPDLKSNVGYSALSDLIDFGTADFDLKIQKTQKININYISIWDNENVQKLSSVAVVEKGKSITKAKTTDGNVPVIAGGQTPAYYHNEANREGNIVTVSASGAYSGFVNYFTVPIFASDCNTVKSINEAEYPTKLIYYCLKILQQTLYKLQRGQAQPHVYKEDIERIKIPVFDKRKISAIMADIDTLEEKAKTIVIPDFDKKIEMILKGYMQ